MFTKLEDWMVVSRGVPIERSCNFSTSELQKWLRDMSTSLRSFAELRGITFAVKGCRMKAAEGFDKRLVSYGRSRNLQESYEQYLIYWIITVGLKPDAVHIATPCTELGKLGTRKPGKDSMLCVVATQGICAHQAAQGYFASVEKPVGHYVIQVSRMDQGVQRIYRSLGLMGVRC